MNSNTLHITADAIVEMEKRFRVNFINGLPGFKSLNLVGTICPLGQANLSIVSTVTHFGSDPPLLGYVSRPETEGAVRHTLSNLTETGVYTINHVGRSFYREAHQTSARYPREVSEFDATGLRPIWREGFRPPFVEASAIQMHLTLRDRIDIPANGTVLVLGQVTDVFCREDLLGADGDLDLMRAGTVTGSGLDGYFEAHKLARLSYAKPDEPVREID